MSKSTYQTSKIFDLDLFSNSFSQLLNLLEAQVLDQKELFTVMTPNPEQVVLSRKNQTFLDQLRSADVLIPDGIGLVWASHLLAGRAGVKVITERITGKDVAAALLKKASAYDWSVLVIGGKGYSHDVSATEGSLSIVESKPSNSVYWTQGYQNVTAPTAKEEQELLVLIKKLKPDIVFVAFGAPQQETWLVTHCSQLAAANVKLAMVVGGAFDVLLGKIRPAPQLLQTIGLEWLFRLIQEPWRWKRQLRLLTFVTLVARTWLSPKS